MSARLYWSVSLTLGLAASTASAQPEQLKRPLNPLQVLIELDANGDRVIEAAEVPDSARTNFDRLLRRGDTNQDGKLQLEEIRGLAEQLRGLSPGPAGGGAERFKTQDKDGDGKLSRNEFPGPPALFDRLDANHDGFLDPAEAARGFAPFAGLPFGPRLIERLKSMDKDRDGKLTREEYQGPPPLFDRLDANHDGVVTAEELKSFPPPSTTPSERKKVEEPTPPAEPAKAAAKALRAGGLARIAGMDKDQDGKVSRDEFTGPALLFDRLDTDGDGFLGLEEFRRAVERLERAKAAAGRRGEAPTKQF